MNTIQDLLDSIDRLSKLAEAPETPRVVLRNYIRILKADKDRILDHPDEAT